MYCQCQYRWWVAERWAWLLWRIFMGLEAFDAMIVESSGGCACDSLAFPELGPQGNASGNAVIICAGTVAPRPTVRMPARADGGLDSRGDSRKTAGTNPKAPEQADHSTGMVARELPSGRPGRNPS